MRNNQQPSECQKCWNLERSGLTSDRQLKNAALDWYWDKDLDIIKQQAVAGDEKTRILKLYTSNVCNSTCVSCNSGASSSWAVLERKIDNTIPIKKASTIDLDRVYQNIDFSELKMLTFVGGEPLYERKNFEVLQRLLESGNDQCFISMVTNGSVKLSEDYKRILTRFRNLNFCVSIDGTGPVFEYLRYPLQWSDLEKNIVFFKELTDLVSANYTLSNLNVLYHNETVAWFHDNSIKYANNPIYTPSWLQPRALPFHVKAHLRTVLSDVDYATYIGEHTDQDDDNFEQFLTQIAVQDQAKKIHLKKYLPELYKLIGPELFH